MISFIVMASGLARRFGDNKLLSDLNGRPVVEHILSKLENIPGMDYEKILVYRNDEIKELGEKYGFNTVENTEFEKGQSESIKAGIKLASENSKGYMFFVADQPFISCETINSIVDMAEKEDYKGIYIPVLREYDLTNNAIEGNIVRVDSIKKRGNPVFFPSTLKEQLLELSGDNGGREVIRKNIEIQNLIPIENELEFFDIDTREDLDYAERILKQC